MTRAQRHEHRYGVWVEGTYSFTCVGEVDGGAPCGRVETAHWWEGWTERLDGNVLNTVKLWRWRRSIGVTKGEWGWLRGALERTAWMRRNEIRVR